jgi:hypothetical protein
MASNKSQHSSTIGAELSGSIAKAFEKLDLELNNKANKNEVHELAQKVDMLALCPDFKLSSPPTVEEVQDINNMEEATLYTINGGPAVMIFRRQYNAPAEEHAPAVPEPSFDMPVAASTTTLLRPVSGTTTIKAPLRK